MGTTRGSPATVIRLRGADMRWRLFAQCRVHGRQTLWFLLPGSPSELVWHTVRLEPENSLTVACARPDIYYLTCVTVLYWKGYRNESGKGQTQVVQSIPRNGSFFRVIVAPRGEDAASQRYVQAARQIGIAGLESCRQERLFFLRGTLTVDAMTHLAQELLTDPITEQVQVVSRQEEPADAGQRVEVALLAGVTDPVAENILRAARLLNITGLEQVATGQCYRLQGTLTDAEIARLAVELFANPVIQQYTVNQPIEPPFVPAQQIDLTVETVALRDASDDTLLDINKERRLSLNLAEMQAIRDYFREAGRDPTDAELEMLAQTWSEHCVHKTFKALITYHDGSAEPQCIDGLLKSYIRGATERLSRPWVRSAFVDNAGIIRFDEHWDLAFKVETHNRPSALEPFGGANTGVGGVIRDVLGVSARPIANTDVLCFGPLDLSADDLPAGVLHPRRVADGVVHGVEDYGNKMGIPTVNGAILYHPGYTANPLVFCGCLGLLPHGSHPSAPQAGDLIVVLGGHTGRDGLRGATFSSMEIDQDSSTVSGSAVQIGHPIHEKQVLEVVLRARDEQLYRAITDCGAGGLSSAVGDMGQHLGARVHLERVPLKYAGLRPWEIWLSEAQERMVLAVAPEHWPRMQELAALQEIDAVAIGSFESTGRLHLTYGEQVVGNVAMDFLHDGIPRRQLEARLERLFPAVEEKAPDPSLSALRPPASVLSPAAVLRSLLAHPNIRSKEAVVRRYDHEVQGGTVVKPLVGTNGQGPGDATVLVPLDTHQAQVQQSTASPMLRGVALGVGICPQYTPLDPYAMAWAAIDEAMRNVVAVGADPDQVALLDNFCWGNPNLPDRLGSLVRCAQGCYDAALAYGAPFVSGKDSLNNEYTGADGQRRAIPGTLLISAAGIVPDIQHTATMDVKQPGNLLYVIGDTRNEMGGSHYDMVTSTQPAPAGAYPPQPVPAALARLRALHRAIVAGLVQACHDCSEGGLGVAVAEMCLAGGWGAQIDLEQIPADDGLHNHVLLFSESLGRFVVEVRPTDAAAFAALFDGLPCARVGAVTAQKTLLVYGRGSEEVLQATVADLERTWRGGAAEPDPPDTPATPAAIARSAAPVIGQRPRVLILHANGTNRDREAALACEVAGGAPEIVHVNQLLACERTLHDYALLLLPGGFSYGDDLGAGVLWALDLRHRLGQDVHRFVESGRPVLGICNGFQALVKAGLLPGGTSSRRVTLTYNAAGRFECRWVHLQPNPASPCLFTRNLDDLIHCPVAHGEGRLAVQDSATLERLRQDNLIALTYVDSTGAPAVAYPDNPNGSTANIAGLCNAAGNVLGLMPHPEDHIVAWQHPRWQRGVCGRLGLRLFENALNAVR